MNYLFLGASRIVLTSGEPWLRLTAARRLRSRGTNAGIFVPCLFVGS